MSSRRRISAIAARPVSSIVASTSLVSGRSSPIARRSAPACTIMIETLCATTSCSSRAIRARSSATASLAVSSRSCSSSTVRAASATASSWRLRTAVAAPQTANRIPPMKTMSPATSSPIETAHHEHHHRDDRGGDPPVAAVRVRAARVDGDEDPGERRARVVADAVGRIGDREACHDDAEHGERAHGAANSSGSVVPSANTAAIGHGASMSPLVSDLDQRHRRQHERKADVDERRGASRCDRTPAGPALPHPD